MLPLMVALTVWPHWICGTLLVPESQPDGGGVGLGCGGGVGDGSQITLLEPKHCEVFTRSGVVRRDPAGVQVSSSVTVPVPAKVPTWIGYSPGGTTYVTYSPS